MSVVSEAAPGTADAGLATAAIGPATNEGGRPLAVVLPMFDGARPTTVTAGPRRPA